MDPPVALWCDSLMEKLAIVGTVHVAPERRPEVVRLLMAHRSRCLKDETGTLQFEVLSPRGDETRLLIYELYRDEAAFEVHRDGASIAQWRRGSAEMGVRIEIVRCTPIEASS